MTIKKFITLAIKGGWGGNFKETPVVEILEHKLIGIHYRGEYSGIKMSIYDIVLQPEVWKAVGKMMHWEEDHRTLGLNESPYESRMVDMIRFIWKGKTVQDYIKTLYE